MFRVRILQKGMQLVSFVQLVSVNDAPQLRSGEGGT